MEERNRPSFKEGQRFEDITTADMDVSEVPIKIEDSSGQGRDTNGFVVLPTKLPLSIILIFAVQCIAVAISLTTVYVEQKTNNMILNEKLHRIENESYSKLESRYLEKEVAELKQRLREEK